MKRTVEKLLALGAGIILLVGFLWSQRPQPPEISARGKPVTGARKVSLARTRQVQIPVIATGVGTIRSRRQTQIASRVLGEVRQVLKQPGDTVQEGEVLILLDDRDIRALVEQAEAELRNVTEALAEARTEYERTKTLFTKDAATKQSLDRATYRLRQVEAQKTAAEKALDEARIRLSYSTITAPFAGLVFEKQVDPGDLAVPGKPLMRVFDPDHLRLEALVEEHLLWHLQIHDRLEISIEARGKTLSGEVSEVVPAVDPSTRTGVVKVDVPADSSVRPGMFGRARIPVQSRRALVVPEAAVVRRGQLEMVFTLEERRKFKHCRMRLVRIGEVVPVRGGEERWVEVLSGLEEGVPVVTTEAEELRDGDPVQPADKEDTPQSDSPKTLEKEGK